MIIHDTVIAYKEKSSKTACKYSTSNLTYSNK